MNTYEFKLMVNNVRTEEIVKANSSFDARKLIEARYPGAKINFITYKQIK